MTNMRGRLIKVLREQRSALDLTVFEDDNTLAVRKQTRLVGHEDNGLTLQTLDNRRLEDRSSNFGIAL